MADLRDVWVYLAASPLLHLTLTLLGFGSVLGFLWRFVK